MKKKIIAIAMAASMVLSLCNVAMAADETITYTADFSKGSTTLVTRPSTLNTEAVALTNPEGTWKAWLQTNGEGKYDWTYKFDNTYAYVDLPNDAEYRERFDFYPTDTVKSLQKIEFDVTSKGAPAISTLFGIEGKKTNYYHLSVSGWSSSGNGGNVSLLKNGLWGGDKTHGTEGVSIATAKVGEVDGTSAWPNGTDFTRHITIELTSSKIKYTVENSIGTTYTNEVEATGADTYTSGQPLVSIIANKGQTQVKYSNVKLTYTREIPATYTANFTSAYTSSAPIEMTSTTDEDNGTYLVGNATDGGWQAYCTSKQNGVKFYSDGASAVVNLGQQNDSGTLSYTTPDNVKTVSRIEYEIVTSNAPSVEMTLGGKYKLRMSGWSNSGNNGYSTFKESDTELVSTDNSETGWPNNGQQTTKKVAIDFNGTDVSYTVKTKNNGTNSGAESTRTGTATLSAPVSVDADAPLMSFSVGRGGATVKIQNVKIWYETVPVVVPVNVTNDNGSVSAVVTLTDASGSGVAILAIYKDGRLVNAEPETISDVTKGLTVSFTDRKVGAGETAKIYIWNSLTDVAPLCSATTVE